MCDDETYDKSGNKESAGCGLEASRTIVVRGARDRSVWSVDGVRMYVRSKEQKTSY